VRARKDKKAAKTVDTWLIQAPPSGFPRLIRMDEYKRQSDGERAEGSRL
jgi:hypothetical protein